MNTDKQITGNFVSITTLPQIVLPAKVDGQLQGVLVGTPGASYLIQSSPDLVNWNDGNAFVMPATGLILVTDTITEPSGFYRAIENPTVIPADMVIFPAGAFDMENLTNSAEGIADELAVHTVNLSAYYMERYEVTKQLWDDVRTCGLTHGYTDLPAGAGKGTMHPVNTVSWYDVVKWSNARSEKENLVPVYFTNGAQAALYKTGNTNVTSAQVKWSANGYRLPTEAEWEKAARGGLTGQRFPRGQTITHSQANYNSLASYAYDVYPTRGYHPTYAITPFPYSSPVGSFAANAHGLFDMAGNERELCWDRYGAYGSSAVTDPLGPSTGIYRVVRVGSWNDSALCRVASRFFGSPTIGPDEFGFRCVRR